jgi:colicin import membrane protein
VNFSRERMVSQMAEFLAFREFIKNPEQFAAEMMRLEEKQKAINAAIDREEVLNKENASKLTEALKAADEAKVEKARAEVDVKQAQDERKAAEVANEDAKTARAAAQQEARAADAARQEADEMMEQARKAMAEAEKAQTLADRRMAEARKLQNEATSLAADARAVLSRKAA